MRVAVLVFYCLLFTASVAAQNPSQAPEIADPPGKFDEWNYLPFSDEKARLDNLSIHWQNSRHMVIYIVIYAGKKSCAGEAEAHWARVRDWLVRKRGVPLEKITWVNGGYLEEPTLTCWIWPTELSKPEPYESLKRSEVKIIKGCKILGPGKRKSG